jgi:hypothetical protein
VNGLRLEEVYIVAQDPVDTAVRWARFAALLPQPESDGVRLETARGRIFIATRDALAKRLGEAPAAPAIAGYAFGGCQPKRFIGRCKEAGVALQKCGARHAAKLPAALGGVWLIG